MKLQKLKDVCSVNSGISPPKDKKIFENGTVPFYKTLDVGRIKIGDISDSELKVSQEFADSKRVFEPGTILFPKSGASTLLNHRVIIQKKGLVASTLAAIVPIKDLCLSKYLFYYLLTIDTKDFIPESFYPGMKISEISEIPIPVPSLQEQEKIVERLDSAFDKIQHIENKHTTEVNFINNFKKSFIKNKFDNNTYELQKLEDFFEITSSKRVFKSEWTNSGIPFLRARELVKLANNLEFKDPIFISESHYEKIKNKYGVPKNGDILITGVGTLGITYLVDDDEKFYFKDGNIIWLKSLNKVNSEFIKLYIDSPDIQTKINNKIGATVKTLTISDANKLEVPVPPKKIQDKLINEIKNFNILLNNFEELNIMKIKKLSLLKKSILNKEFSYE